jgi:DNA repair protein RadD
MSIEQQHDPAPADSLVGLTVKLDRDIGCEKHRPDTSPILRPYQIEVVAQVEQLLGTAARPLIVAPTGSGKTIIFCEIIKRAVANHQRVLVLAHRREIIKHTSAKLRANGVRHGVVMAGEDNALRPQEPVQVCAIATLWVRAIRTNKISLPPADLIIIDEAHHAPARTYQRIVEAFPSATVIGCTATPCRGDGRGLGGIFTTLVETPQIATLIVQRYLVRSRVYAPVTDHDLNLKSVTVRKGDYAENELAERMDRAKLIGDIVTHWHKFGERRKTVAFAVNVAHSIHLRDEFVRSGVHAEHIDGSTPKEERDAALARLASGETEVIVNCMVLTEGFDCPDIGCIIVARPTKKMGLYRQMIGRGLRPADGKTDCVILDHSGATFQHGLPEDYVEWTLDPDHRAVAPAHQARLDRKVASLIECSQCQTLRLGGKPCPNCGFMPRRPGQYVTLREGELGLVENGKAKAPINDRTTREHWHAMLAAIASERGYKPGWTAHKYREKFGSFPTWGSKPEPIEPSPEVRSWVRSRQIAYAKALERGVA